MITTLWPHQDRALEMLRQSLGSGKRRPLVHIATGGGKTITAGAIVDGALRKGNRVLFTVPALSLVDQTVAAFDREGIRDVGVIQADHVLTNWQQPVQIASVQTLEKRKLPKADVVIVDEAHIVREFYRRWFADPDWQATPFIGLSATPGTRGLGKLYDDLISPISMQGLIDAGFLAPFKVFAPDHPDLKGVHSIGGDYKLDELGEVMNEDKLVADVVETWLARGENRPTLCFAVNRAHATNLARQFDAKGVRAGYVDAFSTLQERGRLQRQFHSGEIQVVCNVGVLTTGVDWDVRCIILARPTKSEMLFTQIIGRGLRSKEGKGECLILDHSDTHNRLGFVTDIHFNELDTGKPREKAEPREKRQLPKECPKCHHLRAPKTPVCPCCGFKPEPQSGVKVEDGELIELSRLRPSQFPHIVKQQWYSMLLHVAQQHKYSRGWISHKFREKFEHWPNGMREQPEPPNQEVKFFVKHAQIRFAKGKRA